MNQRRAGRRWAQHRHQTTARKLKEHQGFAIAGAVDRGRTQHRCLRAAQRQRRFFAGSLAGGVVGQGRFTRRETGDVQETSTGRLVCSDPRQRLGPVAIDAVELRTPCRLDQAGHVNDRIGAFDQTRQRRRLSKLTGHDLRPQALPQRIDRFAAQQQAHPPTGIGQRRHEMPADEASGAGHGRERRLRGVLLRLSHRGRFLNGRSRILAGAGVGSTTIRLTASKGLYRTTGHSSTDTSPEITPPCQCDLRLLPLHNY